MTRSRRIFFVAALAFFGFFLAATGCKQQDLTPPLYKHTKWKYMRCTPRYTTDSNVKIMGPQYDTTTGDAQTAVIRKGDREVSFRDRSFYVGENNSSIIVFNQYDNYNGSFSGEMTYYRDADSAYVTMFYIDPVSSYSNHQNLEFWWTVD
jgi:hypothetical protein